LNDGFKKDWFIDEDLIVFEAQRRGIYRYQGDENETCSKSYRRKELTPFLRRRLARTNMTVKGLEQQCLEGDLLERFHKRAFESEKLLAGSPRPKKFFDYKFWDMERKKTFCSVDVEKALKNPMIINILRSPSMCINAKWKDFEYKHLQKGEIKK